MTDTKPQHSVLSPRQGGQDMTEERPQDLPTPAVTASGGVPTMLPPQATGTSSVVGATRWHRDVRVTALWGINQNRNAWVHLSGQGWKKLATTSDSVVVALTILGAHARLAGGRVDAREEDDGMLHELYVW